ncbi:MAG: hypothetical protein ACI9J3_002856 [Parvicellaceae bacterium]|jgi:hypothetical protein
MKKLLLILFLAPAFVLAQKNVTTFGIQFKPIIPIQTFVDGPFEFTNALSTPTGLDSIYSGSMSSKAGYSFGMVIRTGLTKMITIETGINYVRRNYRLDMSKQIGTTIESEQTEFGFVSYSIPVQALIFIKLSENIFMNASTGVSADGYASGTLSYGANFNLEQLSWPHSRIGASYLANLGFELRTKESGYFYLGASYKSPFGLMAVTRAKWRNAAIDHSHYYYLGGQYLTLDLRYFFHEDPATKKKKKKKKKDE